MNKKISERVLKEAEYIIATKATVRETAKYFKISKSTVHKDIQERLSLLNKEYLKQIREILDEHILIRHIKGGNSTKKKYQKGNESDPNVSKIIDFYK